MARILHATSIASARAVLATQAPDIVILDLSLPDGSGSELLPDLRHADGSAIPTVVYSAGDVPPEVEHQVDAVLIKSRRSLDSLARAIQRILATVDGRHDRRMNRPLDILCIDGRPRHPHDRGDGRSGSIRR